MKFSSLSSGQLAGAVVAAMNSSAGSSATRLSALFRKAGARGWQIAEINSAVDTVIAAQPG